MNNSDPFDEKTKVTPPSWLEPNIQSSANDPEQPTSSPSVKTGHTSRRSQSFHSKQSGRHQSGARPVQSFDSATIPAMSQNLPEQGSVPLHKHNNNSHSDRNLLSTAELEKIATRLKLATPTSDDPHRGFLVFRSGTDNGRRVGLPEGMTTIGRGLDNDIVLTDISVSRKHICVVRRDHVYTVSDVGSGNGTTVNDRERKGSFRLLPGDTFQIGNTEVLFERPNIAATAESRQSTSSKVSSHNDAVDKSETSSDLLLRQIGLASHLAARIKGDTGTELPQNPSYSDVSASDSSPLKGAQSAPPPIPPAFAERPAPPIAVDEFSLADDIPVEEVTARHDTIFQELTGQVPAASNPGLHIQLPLPSPTDEEVDPLAAVGTPSPGRGRGTGGFFNPATIDPLSPASQPPAMFGCPNSKDTRVQIITEQHTTGPSRTPIFDQSTYVPSIAQNSAPNFANGTLAISKLDRLLTAKISLAVVLMLACLAIVITKNTNNTDVSTIGSSHPNSSLAGEGVTVPEPSSNGPQSSKPVTQSDGDLSNKEDVPAQESDDHKSVASTLLKNDAGPRVTDTEDHNSKQLVVNTSTKRAREIANATQTAQKLYVQQRFDDAARTLEKASKQLAAKELLKLRSKYLDVGELLKSARSNSPIKGLAALKKALRKDRSLGSSLKRFIQLRIGTIAPQAAFAYMAQKKYAKAKNAADDAARLNQGEAVARVYDSLERKANGLLERVQEKIRTGDEKMVGKLLRQVIAMAPKDSEPFADARDMLDAL